MSIDAIFFDVDDTLFSTSHFATKARRAACEAMTKVGLTLEVDQLEAELVEVVSEFTSNYDQHFDQLLQRIPRRHYKNINTAIIVASAVKAYHDAKIDLQPFPDAIQLLRDLAQVPIVRGVITSGLTIKQAEKLLRHLLEGREARTRGAQPQGPIPRERKLRARQGTPVLEPDWGARGTGETGRVDALAPQDARRRASPRDLPPRLRRR